MFTPPCCLSCGMPLPVVQFEVLRALADEKAAAGRPPVAPCFRLIDPGARADYSAFFDALGVRGDCCRATLATSESWVARYG